MAGAEEARTRADEQAATARGAGMARGELAADLTLAGIALDEGRFADAEAGARRLLEGAAALEMIDAEIRAWALLAWCLAARGAAAGALAAADHAETLVRSTETVDAVTAATIAAAVAAAAGDDASRAKANARLDELRAAGGENVLLRAEADLARALAAGAPGSPARRAALAAFARDARRRGLVGLAQRAATLSGREGGAHAGELQPER